jgi:alcohol dehydrogenase class IV
MQTPFTFKPTPALIFGPGTHTELPALLKKFGSRLLIVVGGNSFLSGKEWPELRRKLQSLRFTYNIVHISAEPSPEDIDSICVQFRADTVDAVVAIGGGSVLDAGKAISAMLIEQRPVVTFLEGVGREKPSGNKIPFIAVPTTSGTGSEATSNAVISKVGENGFKKSLRHDNYIPNAALIDPLLTTGCPRALTVACGMDTFTQLVEGYLSTKSSPLADALALDGIRAVIRSLENACKDGNDLIARTDMAYASYLSGIVLANSGLGVVHAFAAAIGGFFTVPHGIVCGTLMGAANRITLQKLRDTGENPAALNKYTILGQIIFPGSSSDKKAQDNFVRYLESLTENLEIARLSEYGITEDTLSKIVTGAGNKNNPAQLSKEEMREILKMRVHP